MKKWGKKCMHDLGVEQPFFSHQTTKNVKKQKFAAIFAFGPKKNSV